MAERAKRLSRDNRGSTAVEAAFLFPIVLMLFLTSIDMVSYFSTIRKLSASASAASDLLADAGSEVNTSSLSAILLVTGPRLRLSDGEATGLYVAAYQFIDSDPVLRWEYSENVYCGIPPEIDVTALSPDGRDVLVTGNCVNWNPVTLSIFGMKARSLAQYSITSPRRSLTTACLDCTE